MPDFDSLSPSRDATLPVSDYSAPFWLEGPVGNNALSYDRRGPAPRLRVPSLVTGIVDDLAQGDETAFEDFDEHDVLRSCRGLRHLIRTDISGIPTVIVDNHNHVFYFWYEAMITGLLSPEATLVHIDQHRDTRVPERLYEGSTLEDAFRYTNVDLNVGNFIVPAQQARLVGATHLVTGGAELSNLAFASHTNKILDIDLDFFAPEMAYIDRGRTRAFIQAQLPGSALITIATSPFFIDHAAAVEALLDVVLPG